MPVNQVFLKSLGENIDNIRKEKGLSFQELALRCDIEKSNLVKLTKQGTNVTVSTLYSISRGLEVPLTKIFDFKYD